MIRIVALLLLAALAGCQTHLTIGLRIPARTHRPTRTDGALAGHPDAQALARLRRFPNYVVPGEFAPLSGLLIGWQPSLGRRDEMERFFIDLSAKALGGAKVYLMARNDYSKKMMIQRLQEALQRLGRSAALVHDPRALEILPLWIDSVWVRDFGPLSLIDRHQRLHIVDHLFDPKRPNDEQLPKVLAGLWGVAHQAHRLAVAGGNFQSNGAGDCFTALPPRERYQGERRDRITHFQMYLGCQRVHILEPMIREATGHIDMFMSVIGRRDVVIGSFAARTDEANRRLLNRNAALISSLRDPRGAPRFRVHRLPMPYTSIDSVMRSYTNLQLSRSTLHPHRGVVLLPVYRGLAGTQKRFIDGLQRALHLAHPDVHWRIETISADYIIESGGAVHCVTNSIPVGQQHYLKPVLVKPHTAPLPRLTRHAREEHKPLGPHVEPPKRRH